ncbi:MAG: Unknown protein [uncultured Sulfurovum sp.]|uniref:Peptidoglycan binding-like domain-containing protein n=1 Tax=uncultured Sulfurovum sp. TaxID=269237 RepID=A0A6S6ST98_9BACT|nr:MAG: Unknown protein [uncultured Sulfurovum sp.]
MKTLKLLTITGLLSISTLNAQEHHDKTDKRTKNVQQHQEVKKELKSKHAKAQHSKQKKQVQIKKNHKKKVYVEKKHSKKRVFTTLKRGDQGPKVRELQRGLKQKRLYQGRVDGVFGKGVKRAVKKFQRRHNLYADGIAGAKTLRLLYKK